MQLPVMIVSFNNCVIKLQSLTLLQCNVITYVHFYVHCDLANKRDQVITYRISLNFSSLLHHEQQDVIKIFNLKGSRNCNIK